MLRRIRLPARDARRRATVVVQVAVMGTVLVGFAAMSVDVSVMYNAKGQLQRTADAAALAAASRLSAFDEVPDGLNAQEAQAYVQNLGRLAAREYTEANSVLGVSNITVSDAQITFGTAQANGQGGYDFITGGPLQPNAVRVVVNTENTTEGVLPLYFASIFNKDSTSLSAEAIAMLVPRDIAIVADLSASHTDDSELRHVNLQQINLFDIWAALPIQKGNAGVGNGLDPPPPGNPNNENDQPGTGPGSPANAGGNPNPGAEPFNDDDPHGPRWGWMTGWGGEIVFDPNAPSTIPGVEGASLYDPTTDLGLYYIKKGMNTTDPDVIANITEAGYTEPERTALLSSANDSNVTYYRNRTKVLLGLAGWKSKMKDADNNRCSKYNGGPGNGDGKVDTNELTDQASYPFASGSWDSFIDYVRGTSEMTTPWSESNNDSFGYSSLRYRYGIKTFANYLLEQKVKHSETAELVDTPEQPMKSVKDAVAHLVEVIDGLESEDKLSLEIYDTRGRHMVNLRSQDEDFYEVSETLSSLQAGHYDVWTNMGAGVLRAREELSSVRARPNARKVMILLTDGYANVASEYGSGGDYPGGRTYAQAQVALAVADGIQIFCVSVGFWCDTELMDDIAAMGRGRHFHAEGSIDEYSTQLDEIFQELGGRRPVELIK